MTVRRNITAALIDSLAETSTTLCYLLRIETRDGVVIGVTSNNQSVTYDDGAGSVTYLPAIGADISNIDNSAGLEVDNAEANMIFADAGDFTEQKVRAGALDYAEWILYRVDYKNLASGHYLEGRGTTGMARASEGLLGVVELRGLAQGLKQSFTELYSLTCRARFGSGQATGTCGIDKACNFNAEALWTNHTVGSVGSEVDRVFTATDVPSSSSGASPDVAYSYTPGLIQWLTGANTGRYCEVETTALAGTSPDGMTISLRFGTPYDIQAGDTFRIRPDCDKKWETCRDVYSNIANFRGEPTIPTADESAQGTPGGIAYPVFPYSVSSSEVGNEVR